MLSIYADTFMTAAGQPHDKIKARQPSFAWYHVWHGFIQRVTGR